MLRGLRNVAVVSGVGIKGLTILQKTAYEQTLYKKKKRICYFHFFGVFFAIRRNHSLRTF